MGAESSVGACSIGGESCVISARRPLRGLAVLNARRSPALPDVPTNLEAGVPDLESDTLTGIVAPAGTPKTVIDKWRNDIAKMVAQAPELIETLTGQKIGDLLAQLTAARVEQKQNGKE